MADVYFRFPGGPAFVWDEKKSDACLADRGFDFFDAAYVFKDDWALENFDRVDGDEERFHAIGFAAGVLFLTVTFTRRWHQGAELIRIISAREADKREEKLYEKHPRSR